MSDADNDGLDIDAVVALAHVRAQAARDTRARIAAALPRVMDLDRRGHLKLRYLAARDTRRSDPCPCGSGKKFKWCCGTRANEQERDAR